MAAVRNKAMVPSSPNNAKFTLKKQYYDRNRRLATSMFLNAPVNNCLKALMWTEPSLIRTNPSCK